MSASQVGAYRILQQIGEGGMGTVWLAEHTMLGRRAAIKLLHPSFSMRPEIVARFFNEARAATAISDPGIVQIFDFGHHVDGTAYIVMELLEGETLEQRIRTRGNLAITDALRIMRQVASSLGAAHARGIVHRDLKPENIFLVRDMEVVGGERAKILDFGIAKLTNDLSNDPSLKTQTSAMMGTPTYMSPEQCRGAGAVDQRSDVYALGCVLFASITGRPPFDAEGVGDIIAMHLREEPLPPSAYATNIPPAVDHVVMRCLQKQPEARFASAGDLALALDSLRASISQVGELVPSARQSAPAVIAAPTSPTTLSSANGSSLAVPARSKKGLVIGGVATLAIGGAVMALAMGGSESTPAAEPAPASPSPVVAESDPTPPAAALEAPPSPTETPEQKLAATMKRGLATFQTWAASHAGEECPSATALGLDLGPWGEPIAVTCVDQPASQIVGLVSAGPDRTAGTADDRASWEIDRELVTMVRGPRWVVTKLAAKTPAPTPKKAAPGKPAPGKPAPGKPSPVVDPFAPSIPAPPKPPPKPAVEYDEYGIPIRR